MHFWKSGHILIADIVSKIIWISENFFESNLTRSFITLLIFPPSKRIFVLRLSCYNYFCKVKEIPCSIQKVTIFSRQIYGHVNMIQKRPIRYMYILTKTAHFDILHRCHWKQSLHSRHLRSYQVLDQIF